MIQTQNMYITSTDKLRLLRLLSLAVTTAENRLSTEDLRVRLEAAEVLGESEVPSNLVTMNSQVVIRNGSAREVVTLVYPYLADEPNGKLSVLSSSGLALLGRAVGDEVDWPAHGGPSHGVIESILYQPESVGDSRL